MRARTVTDQVPTDGSSIVCDLGAGAGSLGSVLAADRPTAGYRFFEPLDSLASILEQTYGSAARMAQVDVVEQADVTALLDVIEHIHDDHGFLQTIVEAITPGAKLVITVPRVAGAVVQLGRGILGHHRRYTRRSLKELVQPLPLDVVEVNYLFPEFVLPALARRAACRWSAGGNASTTDFPEFSRPIDAVLLAICTVTYRLRRFWPAGTSLVLVVLLGQQSADGPTRIRPRARRQPVERDRLPSWSGRSRGPESTTPQASRTR